MKKLLFLLVVLLVIVLLITGCKSTTTTTSATQSPTTSVPSVTSSSPTQTTAPGTPQYGGTLNLSIGGTAVCLGYPPEAGDPESYYERIPSIEDLVRYDKNGQVQPFLLQSFKADPAAKTVTFTLRPGVKFHDGTVFDAQACKWNIDQLSKSSATGYGYTSVSSVDVVDDLTVRINLKSWDSTFMDNMVTVSPMISPTAFEKNGKDWVIQNPIGTGPFKMVSFTRDVSIVYEKFNDYWQKGKPYLDKVIINIIADPTTRIASFLKAKNDVLVRLDPTDAKNLENNKNVVITKGLLSGGTTSALNLDSANPKSPFNNIKVRQAAAYAIDRQSIVDYIFKGYAYPVYQLGVPGGWAYNPNFAGYPYNPPKAKQLLAEAGYSGGFDTTLYTRNDKIYVDLCTAIQGYLTDVGIRTKLEPLEMGQVFEKVFSAGWPSGTMIKGDGAVNPDVSSTMWITFALDSGWALSKQMLTKDQSDAFESMYRQYLAATDFQSKQSLMWQMQSFLFDQNCLAPNIVADIPLAAKLVKVHDEYTANPCFYPYTFADAWIAQ